MQKRIANFLRKKYLCSLCCSNNDKPWAITCFYVFDEKNLRLIYVSSAETFHSKTILQNPYVAGTVFEPTRLVPMLQGVQFTGTAKMLEGEDAKIATELYKQAYQHQLIDELPIWEFRLEKVRMIDHAQGLFGTLEWERGKEFEEEPSPFAE